MKATDCERSHGAVIGNAMEHLESVRGLVLVLVLVLVNLQWVVRASIHKENTR